MLGFTKNQCGLVLDSLEYKAVSKKCYFIALLKKLKL